MRKKNYSRMARMIMDNVHAVVGGERKDVRMKTYYALELCVKEHKTLGLLLWLICQPLDLLLQGRTEEGILDLLLVFAAVEQAIKDRGRWHTAFPLTMQPEVPWAQVMRTEARTGPNQTFSRMLDESWGAAVASWRRD